MESFPLWKEVIDYARWAPSPHNVQPWKVKLLSGTEAELYCDSDRLLPDEDPDARFITSGFGAFLETLSIALAPHNYEVKLTPSGYNLGGKQTGLILFGKLNLIPNDNTREQEKLDRELIKHRRTSRLPYRDQQVKVEVLEELKKIAQDFGQNFTFSTDKKIIDWVLKLNRDTMFYDMNDDVTRKEVGRWIRYTKAQAISKRDGLWSYCLNVASVVVYIFFHLRWIINLPVLNWLIGKLYLATMRGTSTIGWLEGLFSKNDDWLKSGRMLARLWLTMTKHGVYLHPFGSIITNDTAHQRLREKFQVDERVNTVWLIMRLGYSQEPPRSLRLGLGDILI